MKLSSASFAMCLVASPISAATVQLDWTSGTLHSPEVAIDTVSSVYDAWPTTSIGLYKEKGFEVMLYGDFGYIPDIDVLGGGFVASNDPGVALTSVREQISRSDGKRFSLTSLDTSVGANQVFFNYAYESADFTDFQSNFVESASFDVTIASDQGSKSISPFTDEYIDRQFAIELLSSTLTITDFGGFGQNVNFLSFSSAPSDQSVCDARTLAQAPAQVSANLDCSNPANFGSKGIAETLADGSRVSAFEINDLGSQNWAWTYFYQPTFTVDMTPIPLPATGWFLIAGLLGLVGVRRVRSS